MEDDVRLDRLADLERRNQQLLHALEAIAEATTTMARVKDFAAVVLREHQRK